MKIRLALSLFIASMVFLSCKKDPPPPDVTPPPEENVVQGTFENKFNRYSKGQFYTGATVALWKDTAWQNDRIHKQIVLWAKKEITNITYQVSGLTNNSNVINAANITLRFGKYVLGDAQAQICGNQSSRSNIYIADALSEQLVTVIAPDDPVKIWVTVNVPAGIAPGNYKGQIVVKANGVEQTKFEIDILVLPRILPLVPQWRFHLDLWQFPFQLMNLYNAENTGKMEPFTEKYFSLVEPFYRLLADAGQKSITTYIKDGAFAQGQTMIKWINKTNGTWAYDFSNFDLFVEKMMEWGITKQINCFSLVGWQNNTIGYFDETTGGAKVLTAPPGSVEFADRWNDFLTNFKMHLDTKGWFAKTVLYMDEIEEAIMNAVISVIKANNTEWKIGLAGKNVSNTVENSLYEYSTIFGYNRFTSFTNNRISTFYTSCSQLFPNNYVTQQTNPAEMEWMAWYAASKGFNGYLRWAYDYWTRQDPANVQDGANAAGDFNMIYRSDNSAFSKPISAIRFELLREGIQDYEKIKILASPALNDVLSRFSPSSGNNAASLVNEAQSLLKKTAAQ